MRALYLSMLLARLPIGLNGLALLLFLREEARIKRLSRAEKLVLIG